MARSFNGTSDRGAVALDLSFTNRVAVSFWLWWNAFANDEDQAMEYGADVVPDNGFVIRPNHSSGLFRYAQGLSTGSLANTRHITRPAAATWHHYLMVMRRDIGVGADQTLMYVNGTATPGTLASGSVMTGNFGNNTLHIMCRNATTFFGAGRMSDLAIWAGNLPNAPDAAYLASGGSPASFALSARPYAYWPLRHGSGAPAIGTRAITWTGTSHTGEPARLIPYRGRNNQAIAALAAGGVAPATGQDVRRYRMAERSRYRFG